MTSRTGNPRAKRFGLWLTVVLGILCALWSTNLFIFHFWAAYVPPYKTAFHLYWARVSAGFVVGFVVVVGLASWRLYVGQPKAG